MEYQSVMNTTTVITPVVSEEGQRASRRELQRTPEAQVSDATLMRTKARARKNCTSAKSQLPFLLAGEKEGNTRHCEMFQLAHLAINAAFLKFLSSVILGQCFAVSAMG